MRFFQHPSAVRQFPLEEAAEEVQRNSLRKQPRELARPVKLLVYSHDTFGLGNIRRMLAICEHLYERIPGMCILIVTGSPMLHSFRLSNGIDYVKLPCLRRDMEGSLRVKYLDLSLEGIVRLRSRLILSTIANFRPDIVLVDKKPGGLAGELEESLEVVKADFPGSTVLLLLRDILDDSAITIDQWRRQRAYEILEEYYHGILVVGLPDIYDIREEYQFPSSLRAKVHFCGYLGREVTHLNRDAVRQKLQIGKNDRMILVTTGGGEDGLSVIRTYLLGLRALGNEGSWKSLIITGPELSEPHKREVIRLSSGCSGARVIEFTREMMTYLDAADVVVAMAGYNTICEILSLRKRAVIVPRIAPVAEQRIRAERMARLSLFRMIHPAKLTPQTLMHAVRSEVEALASCPYAPAGIDLDALCRIDGLIRQFSPERAGRDRVLPGGGVRRKSA